MTAIFAVSKAFSSVGIQTVGCVMTVVLIGVWVFRVWGDVTGNLSEANSGAAERGG